MSKKLLVSLYSVSNGFMAETLSGEIIVELELSKLLESVGAQLTSDALSENPESEVKRAMGWERIL